MSNITITPRVSVIENQLMTSSHTVASEFNKSHAHVLRDLKRLKAVCPEEWFKANFGFRFEINRLQNGKPIRVCDMTKDGFMLLVMGFTGEKAMQKKIEFIDEFNRMAVQLNSHNNGLWEQMQALIAREVQSQVRASYGSQLLLARKRELPSLRDEREILESAIQPSLLN